MRIRACIVILLLCAGCGDAESGSTIVSRPEDGGTDSTWEMGSEYSRIPTGCELVANTVKRWTGNFAIHRDRMVWSNFDPDPGHFQLFIHELSRGKSTAITSFGPYKNPTIWGDDVYWFEKTDPADALSSELFQKNVQTSQLERLTRNSCAEYGVIGGKNHLVYKRHCDGEPTYLSHMNLETKQVVDIAPLPRGRPSGYDFDGHRWVVWIDNDSAYKFDLRAPTPPALIDELLGLSTWPEIAEGRVFSGSWRKPPFHHDQRLCDIHVHDLKTGKNKFILSQPWDQIQPSPSGKVVAYLDTETLGHKWFSNNTSQVEIGDIEIGMTRQITTEPGEYYSVALNGKNLAFTRGANELYLCDLERGGYIDTTGHVIPRGVDDIPVDGRQ